VITFDEYLSRIIDTYTTKEYEHELIRAKKDFFGFIGTVHEEDSFFETYMTAFIEWYIFDRDMTDKDLPPVRLYYRYNFKNFTEEDQKIYNDFTKFRHSLFVAKKVTASTLVIHNLYEDKKISIENTFPTAGFNVGDIFDAILVPFQGQWAFTKTFFFHPQEVKSFIIKEVKKTRNLELNVLLKVIMRLRRLRLKMDRYPYVSPSQIYTPEEFNRSA